MLFICIEDFFAQAEAAPAMSWDERAECARVMAQDPAARQRLIHSYLPLLATRIRRGPQHLQTLQTAYACLAALEKCIDSFDFQQGSSSFTRRLSWALRQCIVRCLAQ